jgi:hypothetical protein
VREIDTNTTAASAKNAFSTRFSAVIFWLKDSKQAVSLDDLV